MYYRFSKILISCIIILFFFFLGIFVGHNKIFPYYQIKNLKNIIFNFYPISKGYEFYDILTRDYYHKKMIDCVESVKLKSNLDNEYNFFVAGHVYGRPGGSNKGIYPKFLNYLDNKNFSFGFFTGDIVRQSNKESWDVIDNQI